MSSPICVVRTKQFKDTAKRLNLSEDALERIVHKYVNKIGDADAFPTDSYIKVQYSIENFVSDEEYPSLLKIWNNKFRNPIIVDNLEKALKVKEEALKFFKGGAVSLQPLNDGTYKITVARPRTMSYKEQKIRSTTVSKLQGIEPQDSKNELARTLRNAKVESLSRSLIMRYVDNHPKALKLTPYEIYMKAIVENEDSIAKSYNANMKAPVDQALEALLRDFLKRYNFEINEDVDMEKLFEDGVLGAIDIINKTIYLAKNGRNALTFPEEFAHAFVELMGAVSRSTKSKDYDTTKTYSELYKEVTQTSIYRQVYEQYKNVYIDNEGKPDLKKIRKEAIGQALATALVDGWNSKKLENEADKSFWQKLKDFFSKILDMFKDEPYLNFESKIAQIADDILNGDHSKLSKVDSSTWNLMDYEETITNQNNLDGGIAISTMQFFSEEMGNIITGSFSYRKQGTIYRAAIDTLHDIDMRVPKDAHGIDLSSEEIKNLVMYYRTSKYNEKVILEHLLQTEYFKKVLNRYPDMRFFTAYPDEGNTIVISSAYSPSDPELAERFSKMKGSYNDRLNQFTKEERSKIYLYDFFLMPNNGGETIRDEKNGITLASYAISFEKKLEYARAKDLFDYQYFKIYTQYRRGLSNNIMYQKAHISYDDFNEEQKNAVNKAVEHIDNVRAGKTSQKFFTIQGKAGTGKTTIVGEILNRMKTNTFGRPLVISGALSHKATTVLKGKISPDVSRNFQIDNKTIAGMLGLKPDRDGIYKPEPGKIPPINYASVVIIDEASMLNEEQLELIQNAVKDKRIPIIFLGDKGQLPPIRSGKYFSRRNIPSDKLSPVFEDSSIPSASLVTRVRQGEDSPVLNYADRYWNYSQGKREEYPNDLDQKSEVTDRGALIIQNGEIDVVMQLAPLFEEARRTGNPNLVKIVSYTNNSTDSKESAVDKYNRRIREILYPGMDIKGFMKGDLIMFNDNFAEGQFPNSLEGAIVDVRPCEPSLPEIEGLELEEVEREYITFNSNGNVNTVPALIPTRANKLKHFRNINKLRKFCVANPRYWPKYYAYRNSYAADVGYAYAIDSHKSQGSTYDVVVVDAIDINSVQPTTLVTKAQSIYTSLTRASNVTIVSSNTTNENTIYTDIKAINDRINSVKEGTTDESEFVPATEEGVFAPVEEEDLDKLIANPKRKVKTVKKKGNVSDTEFNPLYENAKIDGAEEEFSFDDLAFDEEEEDDDFEEEEEDKEERKPSGKKTPATQVRESPQQKTYREFTAAQRQLNSIIQFRKKSHTYLVNGKKADFSITEFKDFILGNKRKNNDFLEISSRLGNSHDSYLRDYFSGDLQDEYPNLSKAQMKKLRIQASKLETMLTNEFGEDAIFITDEDLLKVAATVTYEGQEYTVAGTMDMVVIDSKGDIHLVDFKTKRANLSGELEKGKIEEYAIQVSLYKASIGSNSLFKTRMGKTMIAQFNLKYADPRTHEYSFKEGNDQIYVEVEGETLKIQEAQERDKEIYSSGVFVNKLRGLSINLNDEGIKVSQVKTEVQKRVEQKERNEETSVKPKKGKGQMVEFYGSQKRSDIKAVSTFGAILEGKRTATTRTKHWDYWKKFNVGDIITFDNLRGRTVDVRVTVAAHKLSKDLDLDEWSEKEGWTKDRFTKNKDKKGKTLMDYTKKGEAFQIEYELIDKKAPSSIEVNSYSKKYAQLSNFGDKEFEIDGKIFPTVEHYFQWAKAIHCKNYAMANRIKKAVSAKQAKYLGTHELEMTKAQQKSWDKFSRNVMKKGMREAFEQNDDAKALLLSTGTALLTHFYNSKTKKSEGPFADILMELREEFGGTGKPTTVENAEEEAKEAVRKSKEVPNAPKKKETSSSQFIESKGDYPQRTKENAEWSDITLDLTESDKGSGGRNELTKRVAGDKYVHFKLTTKGDNTYDADEILAAIEEAGLPTKNIKLNIAGSEIGKLKNDQERYNEEVTRLLKDLQELGVTISEIRSGGQTGVDEAGIIAAQRLGIKWSVNAPKGWKFRDAEGNDHEDEEAFKARFGAQTNEWTRRGEKQFKISSEGYRKGDPQKNSDVAYVFTENAQAYVTANKQDDSWIPEGYNKGGKVKLKVSDVKGTNQAGIRTDEEGNLSENAFGVVVKKYQQKEDAEKFLTKEGQFQDTDEDFELFKSLNIDMFERLNKSGLKKIVFPSQMAKGKAALPRRFAEWLAEELKTRYGVISTIQENENSDYEGYGLSINSIQEKKVDSSLHVEKTSNRYTPKTSSDVEQFNTAAEALRKQGWHVEFYSKRSKANKAFTFTPSDYSFGDDRRPKTFHSIEQAYQYYKLLIFEQAVDTLNYPTTNANIEDLRKSKKSNREAILSKAEKVLAAATDEEVANIVNQPIDIAPFVSNMHKPSGEIVSETKVSSEEIQGALNTIWASKEKELRQALNQASVEPAYINDVMTISIEGNPKKGFFELVKDQEEGNYSVHFKTKSKKAMNDSEFAEEALEDSEKEDMFKALIYAIPEGSTVSTWGTLSKGGISALDSLTRRSGGALQKIGDKLAKDSEGNDTRIPVYKKLTEDEIAEASISKVRKIQNVKQQRSKVEDNDSFFGLKEALKKDDKFTSVVSLYLKDTSFYELTDITDGSKDEQLESMIKGLPYSTLIELDTSVVNPNLLYILKELTYNPLLHMVPTQDVITVDPNSLEGMTLQKYAEKNPNINYNKETGELRVPKFTVGYSIKEIEEMAEYNRLIDNDLLTQEELRTLSKATVYKVSALITMIQSTKNGYEKIFGETSDKDFTTMSRIQIIREVGLEKLFNEVKERVFNSNVRPEDTSIDVLDKIDIIHDNWNAFIKLGYETLINLEEIAFDSSQRYQEDIKTELNDNVEGEDEAEIQEVFGDSLEHWQIGFRQVSAFSSLSQLIKRAIDSLYELDEEGNEIVDEFGLAKHLDAQAAVSKILYFTQGAQSLDDRVGENLKSNSMLYLLKERVKEEPWLKQIIELLEGKYNEDGELVQKADEQFKAQFYSNFKKYFQKYCITFKDKKKGNKIAVKVINEHTYSDVLTKECQAKENSFALGGFKLKTKEGTINQDVLKALQEKVESLEPFVDRLEAGKKITKLNEYHKLLEDIFSLLDIEVPSKESVRNLFHTKKNAVNLKQRLTFLLPQIKNGVTITNLREYKQIVDIVAKEMGLEMESVTYESGKMYYSYVLPSYLGRLVTKLKGDNMSKEEYQDFLQNEYLRYRWFNKSKKVRCYWLDLLKNSEEIRSNFEHVTSLHYLGKNYSDKTPLQYIASMMRMYFYDNNKKWAYFRIPMLSNKPSEEYVKFRRLSSATVGDWKDFIAEKMWDVFTQELDRIQAVNERKENINSDQKILSKGKKETFDKRGAKFVFEDYLNKYLDGTFKNRPEYDALSDEEKQEEELFSKLLQAKVNGTLNSMSKDSGNLITLFKKMTTRGFEENYQLARQQWVDEGFITLKEDGTIKSVAENLKLSEDDLREFYWNDAFAATQVLELTVTDIAYYVDTEDLQKRLAQLHAPGRQAHIGARDAKGNLYTKDGIERTLYIKDDMVRSSMLANLKMARRQILSDTPSDRRQAVARQLDGIIQAFESINFADAQGYSCPSSYRKKMGIFGDWDSRMEEAYEKVIHPEKYPDVNLSDMLDVLWQPLKPFVYTQMPKPGYNDVLPELKVSVQNKNSEYVLVMADALLRRTGIPNKLRAIYEFMEESQHNSDGTLNGEGIDTVQFMSAVNAGCTGVIDLNDTINSDGSITYKTEEEVKEELSKAYKIGEDGKIEYDMDYVHEIPFEDYIIQQNVPAHFMKHEQAHGSQDRILTFADMLDEDPVTGETNYLEIDGKKVSVAEAKKNYFKAIADNIEESKKELIKRFNLDPDSDQRAKNVALSKVLKDTILRDSRYGADLYWACSTNELGEFNIPLSDPTQATRIQQLLNSIIKNTINKQKIAGGPIVQVSNWGVSDQLNIRFKNSEGKLLLTEREFKEVKSSNPNKQLIPIRYIKFNDEWQSADEFDTYEDYIYDQAGVAYFEALVPIPDENFAKDFMRKDANGNEYIDVEEIERVNPDLLYMIGYRIPTESKYSMVPIKIKGFLPRVGGEGIMLPADITSLAGSDFDIDKEYIMRFAFNRIEKDGKVTYEKPKSGRGYRNNLIIATQLAVLKSEQVQKQLFTPGNFDEPKKYGYLISYVQNEAARTGRDTTEIWEEALEVEAFINDVQKVALATNRDPKEVWEEAIKKNKNLAITEYTDDFNDWLKDKNKTSKNLIFNNVQVQFHKQNMTAAKLIGIFAQANVSHAFISLEKDTTLIIPNELSFAIDGISVSGRFLIDDILTRDRTTNISNNLAAFLAASVDAVKDPILNLMNININTANVVTSLIRMGLNIETVSLLVSQPVIKNLIKDYAIRRTKGGYDINVLIEEAIDKLPEEDVKGISDIAVTTEALIDNLNGGNSVTDYMVLRIFGKMQEIADAFGDITHMTRYNSVTAAVGPFASDTMLQKIKDAAFNKNEMIGEQVRAACDNPILMAFRDSAYEVEKELLGRNLIQAGIRFEVALQELGRVLGFRRGVPSDMALAFSDFFMSFYVNDSGNGAGSVFDLSYENRKRVLTEFPKNFLRLKRKYKNNLLVNSIQYVENDREQYPFLELKTRGLNPTALEDIKNAWITLLYESPESRDLALAIVEYNYFRGSFGFSPKTFMNLVPNAVKQKLNNYINVLNNKDSKVEVIDDTIDRIINQFILHNPDLITDNYYRLENYNPTEYQHDVYGECIEIDEKADNDEEGKYTIFTQKPFIRIDKKTFFVVQAKGDKFILKEVDELGGDGQGFELSVDERFPKSIYDKDSIATNKGKKEGRESARDDEGDSSRKELTEEQLGVVLDQLFDEEGIEELGEEKIPRAIDKINKALTSSEYDLQISKSGRMQKRLLALLDKLDGVDNPEEVLNSTGETIESLGLCK